MSTQLTSKLEAKIEALYAFTAVGSSEFFPTLDNEIQLAYLSSINNLVVEIRSDYQLVIKEINSLKSGRKHKKC